MSDIARRHPSGTIYRLGRRDPGAWRFPDWLHADVVTGTFGSRYDDPEGEYRVLYCCSSRFCAFVEVLWYHTADAKLDDDMSDIDENDDSDINYATASPGHLDVDAWCAERSVGTATIAPGRAFASTTDVVTVATLSEVPEIAARAMAVGLPAYLSGEDVRMTTARQFTQRISRFVWEQSTTSGEPAFAGIHYLSRHDESADNWALFELESAGVESSWSVVEDEAEAPIETNDPDLLAAIRHHGITPI